MIKIVVIALICLLVLGMPISFALMLSGLIAVSITGKFPEYMVCQRFIGGINSFPLMAVPLYILGGSIMNYSGISKKIVNFCQALLCWLRGSTAMVCVAANMIFGGITGSGTAAVSAIGSITAPELEKKGYPIGFIGGIIAGGGSTAPIIPPSTNMIVIASITGLSVSKMFMGGLLPGILIGVIIMIVCYFYAKAHNIDYGGKFKAHAVKVALLDSVWALIMPLIILGGVFSGVFTATEAGAVACVYGLIVGIFIYKELNFKTLWNTLKSATIGNAQVMSLFAASTLMGYIFSVENLSSTLQNWLTGISESPIVIALLVYGLTLIIGCFLDPIAAMPVILPVVFPLLKSMGFNMIQFGVTISICTIIGGLTPPVGSYLFMAATVLRTNASKIIPWISVMVIIDIFVAFLCAMWAPLTTFLPGLLT